MNDLEGRTAVVTGAARGIGRAIAVALASNGASVAGIDIAGPVAPDLEAAPATPEDLQTTATLVREQGVTWSGHHADTRDIGTLRLIATAVEQEHGDIDIVVANAGIQEFASLLDMSDEHWDAHIQNNLTGTANTIRAFAPAMVHHGRGRIIVTSSTQGQHGMMLGSAYAASKWGILGLMKSAALELGRYGITVNALVPGLVDTELTQHESRYAQVIEDGGGRPTDNTERDEAATREALARRLPLGVPWLEPEDLAPAVVFLASDGAHMVSGTTLAVTGGDSARITA